jgi:hypothetical protein
LGVGSGLEADYGGWSEATAEAFDEIEEGAVVLGIGVIAKPDLLVLFDPPEALGAPVDGNDAVVPGEALELEIDELVQVFEISGGFDQFEVEFQGLCLGAQVRLAFVETDVSRFNQGEQFTEQVAGGDGDGEPVFDGDFPFAMGDDGVFESLAHKRFGEAGEGLVELLREDEAEAAGEGLTREFENMGDGGETEGFQVLQACFGDAEQPDGKGGKGGFFLRFREHGAIGRVGQRPACADRSGEGEANTIALRLEVMLNRFEKHLFSVPEVGAAGDVAQEGFGLGARFEPDERREALAVDGEMAQGLAISLGIGGEELSFGEKCPGLGQGLTGPEAEFAGTGGADADHRAAVGVIKGDKLAAARS